MSTAVATVAKRQKKSVNPIPTSLIYEIVRGKPIYHKGYKQVLNGTKTLEEIKMESILQSSLKAIITALILFDLRKKGYHVATGEMGINLSKQDKRGADIAIFKRDEVELVDKFADTAPTIIIEIDVRAEIENGTELEYVSEKTRDYHQFGVNRLIWVFTKAKKVLIANAGQPWVLDDWSVDVEVMEGIKFNIAEIIKNF